jgi:elongation factor G
LAFREGARKAKPVLLEPKMKFEIVTPEDYMGEVNGDLNRRRVVLQGLEDAPAGNIVRAEVPLEEINGYATQLRSMSQGRATYTMEFSHYAEVPANVAEGLIRDRVG